ncbi:MAG: TonB-dependent receptor [Acidobacteria bacterium]|nr:TonB-dependent receptor [Acidobacteriota bacterium]
MKICRISSLFLLFLSAASLNLYAAILEGTVYDPSGKPVPGAQVSLLRALVAVGTAQSNTDGVYRFDGLQTGTYQVSASLPGLTSAAVTVDLTSEGAKQDIQLKLSAVVSRVVVSAALGGALSPEIGSSVSLVSSREIEDRGAQNALEVIRGIPGIEVNQTGRRGAVTGVFIRGGESKYNAVMVDGMQINEFGGPFNMASLPADGIEQLEVTRGPQSALYGSNALTGVINIVTRRGEGPPKFTALAEGGSYSTRRFATGGDGRTKGLSWSYNLSRLDSEGVVENDFYRNQTAFLNLGFQQGGRREFKFRFMGNANHNGVPGAYGSNPNNNFPGIDTTTHGKQNLFGYQLQHVEQFLPRLRQVTTATLTTNDVAYYSLFGYTSENLRGVFNTRSEITLSNTDTLAAGFEFNREQIRHSFITDGEGSPFLLPRTSLAYFVENRWSPSSRFYLVTGIRVDDLRTHSLPADMFGTRPFRPETSIVKVNPRISASYIARSSDIPDTFGGTRIHGSMGTGIRPPDGFDLAFTNNPNLKPERSISFDAGLEQMFFASRVLVDATYFINRFEDQIVTIGGSLSNLSSYSSDNLKNSRAQGLEFTFRVVPVDSLELGGQYTFTDASILALDGSAETGSIFEVGQQLLRRPRHSAAYNVTWRYKRLTLNTNAYIRGSVLDVDPTDGLFACTLGNPCIFDNPGYTRVDGGFSYRLPHGAEIYARVYNILNKKYEETFGFPALGANFMAGMKFAIPAE